MTYIFAILAVLISIVSFQNRELFDKLKFNAYAIKHHKQLYRFLSHGFVHGGWAHLLFNMLVLISFGTNVESSFKQIWGNNMGVFYFSLLYVGSLIISSAPSYFKNQDNEYYNAVGASGAISAVLFASILFAPWSKIYIIFIPIGIPAFIFGGLYLIFSAYMAKKATDNIGHDAHFWGAIFGLAYTIILKPSIFVRFLNLIVHNE